MAMLDGTLMLTTIAKSFDFDAAHRLDKLPPEHKCHRLHGHTYRVEVRLRGEPDRRGGMLVDYALIAEAWRSVHDVLDHRYLNEIPGLEVPTTEVLAAWIYGRLQAWRVEIHKDDPVGVEWKSLGNMAMSVRVYESSTTYAEVGRT
jgi:6-pyruvoyltetrahydropterin/6-carboxytetrahydropterin synthase